MVSERHLLNSRKPSLDPVEEVLSGPLKGEVDSNPATGGGGFQVDLYRIGPLTLGLLK